MMDDIIQIMLDQSHDMVQAVRDPETVLHPVKTTQGFYSDNKGRCSRTDYRWRRDPIRYRIAVASKPADQRKTRSVVRRPTGVVEKSSERSCRGPR